MKLKPGDVLICKGKSWISKAIMKVTGGVYSHTALFASAWGSRGVIEAQKNGVNFKLWKSWRDKWDYDYIVFRYNKEFDHSKLMQKAFSKSGETRYDFFTFFLRIPYRLITGKNKEKDNEDKKMICSEYTSWVWDIEGWYQMTPQEQYEYMVNSNDWDMVGSNLSYNK